MKIGGYVAASERMGIDLNARTLKDNEYYERINPTVGLDIQKKADKDGFLTLGRCLCFCCCAEMDVNYGMERLVRVRSKSVDPVMEFRRI